MRETINAYLSLFDLDIRKSHDARYVDQKCTPDIVCFMADCVLNMVATKPKFVINDVWETQYFIQNSRVIFNKPWANDKKAYNEYNKVLSQPLKLLAYAHILHVETVDGSLTFSVANEDLLDYISRKDRNAYNFLYCYFMKVMSDSGFIKYFEDYEQNSVNNPVAAKDEIYDQYYRLINGNTPSHSRLDIRRMFHKVFNVYAAEHHLRGSNGEITYYSDLMYNKKNWRDMDKDKTITRQEAMSPEKIEKQEVINAYYVQKAIALIRKIQTTSEVNDAWGNGEATQVHHIFPKAGFPQIAHYAENLILLTASQHNTKAHPNNKTQQINKDYQLVCLLAKANTIETSLRLVGERYYRKESFVYVINTGLSTDFSTSLTFGEIKTKLVQIYNAA
ncbi:hypothetical protein [Bacteroides acidifaciens]|uniref:hypothetical protein n=1 Tax=Bacteroides acidifaciens TaxID=85831 RepID=UPI0025959CBD|nr:hypothetical protein [Bacteroides acidifaciens]